MSAFQEMVRDDITDVFLDLEMFGETHMVAGKECTIVLDDYEKLRRNERYQDTGAIYRSRKLFYIAAADFGKLPGVGMMLALDGKTYKVVQAEEESGVYAITIDANVSERY